MTEVEYLERFAKHLVLLRQRAGFSQEELAERAGLHAVAITYIETGKRIPKLNTLYRLVTGLGISIEELVRCEDTI